MAKYRRPDKASLNAAVSTVEQADSAMKLIIRAELERYQAQIASVSGSAEESEE
ncbi:MAG: hypothetical protein K2H45_12205 [Acetatifactor sp.]|nr:hypothetical protein [Acetatifactor sp.]